LRLRHGLQRQGSLSCVGGLHGKCVPHGLPKQMSSRLRNGH
jgi:hypothetical protein